MPSTPTATASPPVAANVAATAVVQEHVALHCVAALVGCAHLLDGVPGADVGPAHVDGDELRAVGGLHHRGVDRLGGAAEECVPVESEEVEIPGGPFDRRLARRVDIGPRPRQGLQIAVAPEQEDARVPIEIARRRVSFRRGQIRLFDEAFDTEAGTESKRPATANIAVPGFGPSGSNAEGDEMAGLCAAGAFGNGTPESRTILDVMVGRYDEHDRTGLDPCEMKGRDRRRWRGVPAHRLQEKRAVAAPASWSCAATMKRLSCEVTITGRRNPSRGGTRATVACSGVRSPASGRNCFGQASRDSGQSREPVPPHSIVG